MFKSVDYHRLGELCEMSVFLLLVPQSSLLPPGWTRFRGSILMQISLLAPSVATFTAFHSSTFFSAKPCEVKNKISSFVLSN